MSWREGDCVLFYWWNKTVRSTDDTDNDDAERPKENVMIRWVMMMILRSCIYFPYFIVRLTVCFCLPAFRTYGLLIIRSFHTLSNFGWIHCEYIIIQNGMFFWTVSLLRFFEWCSIGTSFIVNSSSRLRGTIHSTIHEGMELSTLANFCGWGVFWRLLVL